MILRSLFESPFSMILAFLPIPYLKLASESLQYKYRWNRSTKKGSSPVLGDGYREGHWFGVHSPCLGVPCLPGFRLFDFGYLHIHSAILRVEPKLRHQLLYVFMRVLPDLILYIFRVLVFWLRFITGDKYRLFHLWHHVNLKFQSVSDEDGHAIHTVSNRILLLVPWLNLQLTTLTLGLTSSMSEATFTIFLPWSLILFLTSMLLEVLPLPGTCSNLDVITDSPSLWSPHQFSHQVLSGLLSEWPHCHIATEALDPTASQTKCF